MITATLHEQPNPSSDANPPGEGCRPVEQLRHCFPILFDSSGQPFKQWMSGTVSQRGKNNGRGSGLLYRANTILKRRRYSFLKGWKAQERHRKHRGCGNTAGSWSMTKLSFMWNAFCRDTNIKILLVESRHGLIGTKSGEQWLSVPRLCEWVLDKGPGTAGPTEVSPRNAENVFYWNREPYNKHIPPGATQKHTRDSN